jgi:hypothetical protein
MPRKLRSSALRSDAVTVANIPDGEITAAKLSSSAIEDKLGYVPASAATVASQLATLVDSAPEALNTLNELAAALGNDANFASTITNALALKVSIDSSTGAAMIPVGTTAQRPVSAGAGATRFNTTTGSIEFYDGANWISTNLIPTVNSVTGTIFAGVASTLNLSLSNATDAVTVRFTEGGVFLADVSNVAVTSGSASVSVPSNVFNQTAGDTIAVSVINQDGTPSSNAVTRTVQGLPTGGTITQSGGFRIHTFASSGNFVVPSGITLSNTEYLVIAGGGGGANGRSTGGGGAGGYRNSVVGETSGGNSSAESRLNLSAGSYTVTVGAGGAGGGGGGGAGAAGQNSVFSSVTSTGGGFGAIGSAVGGSGGSGGGAASGDNTFAGGSGTSGQGRNGGAASGTSGLADNGGGGGGGASGVGLPGGAPAGGPSGGGGAGGGGLASSITGTSITRAGGGGGTGHPTNTSASAGGAGGAGGGGAGNQNGVGANGTESTGSGGGSGSAMGGNGGSGIVIIRYQL